MTKRSLLAVVILLWSFGANTQLFNPVTTAPFSGVFGPPGTPPIPFFNQVAAVNYNYGGQGVGYKVPSPACVGITCVAGASTYRADAVNFKASTFGSGFNWQLAFSASPNAWNYTINISQPGPYIITLWTGSASIGGSWNILIDNVLVGNVVTPNTGNYSTLVASSSAALNPTPTLGSHILTIAWASGDGAGGSGDLVAWQGGVQPIVAGLPCDIGPNYNGPVPGPAAAAGFNHCVANYDFTTGTGTFSNVNNFIDICGASSPLLYDRTYTAFHQPCGDYAIVDDTANGGPSHVLRVQFTQADKATNTNTITFLGTTSGSGDPTPPGVWLKSGWYAEEVRRNSPTTVNSACSGNPPGAGGCLLDDFWSYPVQGSCAGCPNNLEFDFVEVYTGNDGTNTYASAGLASGGGSGVFPGIGNTNGGNTSFLTSYNTYGALNTVVNSSSGNNYSGCWYLNPQTGAHSWSCVNSNLALSNFATNMEFYLAEIGIQPGTALPYLIADATTFIQRMTIFACGPAGANTPCYNSSVVNY